MLRSVRKILMRTAFPRNFAVLAAALLCSAALAVSAGAEPPAVTTGLGYKPMVQELCALYAQKSGQKPVEMYNGNIGQMLEQIRAGSGASVVVSDRATLESSNVAFAEFRPLGRAVLMLAWKKGVDIRDPADLKKPEIGSIGYPDAKAAIYGKAAVAFMKGNGLYEELQPRLTMFSTVPQVFSYLVSGNLDAAFVNEALIRKQGGKIGGWMELDKGYEPLFLVAGVVRGVGGGECRRGGNAVILLNLGRFWLEVLHDAWNAEHKDQFSAVPRLNLPARFRSPKRAGQGNASPLE